jgi:hypothetical protein
VYTTLLAIFGNTSTMLCYYCTETEYCRPQLGATKADKHSGPREDLELECGDIRLLRTVDVGSPWIEVTTRLEQ